MLQVKDYHKKVDMLFSRIESFLEEKYSDVLEDIDLLEKSIEISFVGGKVFLLNKNEINQEIWFSSPLSGGHKFVLCVKNDEWLNRDEEELFKLFTHEVSILSL